MISVSTRLDRNGFWYLVDAAEDSKFTLSYIVIGTGGRQGSGEIEAAVSKPGDWRHVEIAFPVLHVGITDLRISSNGAQHEIAQQISTDSQQLSRRRMIKTNAGTLLAGSSIAEKALNPNLGHFFNPYAGGGNLFSGSH